MNFTEVRCEGKLKRCYIQIIGAYARLDSQQIKLVWVTTIHTGTWAGSSSFTDLIQVLRDLKVTHPSLERLESDSSKSSETWKWLIQVLGDLKVTHPSLERLENNSSKSWETWKWLIKKINHIQAPDVLGFGEGDLQKTGILQSFYRSGKVCTRCVEHSSIPHLWCPV